MEPQEGDIAEDGAGNFLVRRGNDWYPAQQDGRPLQRIPRPDYGANHFQLPNGDIVRQGPQGGQTTIENFGGAGGGSGGGALVSADQRGRYAIGADPLLRAEQNLAREEADGNPLNRDWGAVALNAIDLDPRGGSSFRPFAPLANLWGDQDYQNAQQALSTYEASLMPIQSGASVTASEAARQIRADFPALWDSAETLRRKAANRRDRINAIFTGIGRPAPFSDEDATNPSDVSTEREVAALAGMGAAGGGGANELRIRDLLPDETPEALAASGRVRGADGVWRYPRDDQGNPIFPEDAPAMGGYETALAQERANADLVSRAGGGVDMGLQFTGPFNDELAYAEGFLRQGVGNIGRRLAGRDIEVSAAERGRASQDVMRQDQERFGRERPAQNIAANLLGATVSGPAAGAAAPSLLRMAGQGVVEGGIYGGAASERPALERGGDILQGAAIGGVLAPVARVVGDAVIEPVVGGAVRAFNRTFRPHALVTQADEVAANMGNVLSDPRAQAVQTLTDNGVYLTSGQRAGGLAQTVESLAQRAPILGTAIRGARNRGRDSLNRAVGNRALDAIDEGLPANIAPGGDAVTYVSQRLGQEFDRAAEMVPEISATPELREGVARVFAGASDLPEVQRQQLEGILESRLARLNEPMTGTQYRTIEREIDGLASQYGGSQDPAQQQMGRILEGVGGELRAHLGRVNPEAGEVLRRASDGWADFVRMRRASVASGAEPFSPGQLKTAVRTEDSSVAHGAVGRGDARMQDLSRAASMVMPDSYGNPGTADAAGWGGLGIGMLTAPVQTTGIAATLGVGALPYAAAGRNVAARLPAAASRQTDRLARRFLSQGFSEDEARGLAVAAVDPARAREVIDFLATRMNRQEARSTLRAIRFSAARGAGEYAGDEE